MLKIVPPEEAKDSEHLAVAEPARLGPIPARATRRSVEQARSRADEALQARVAAEEKAERAALAARSAERARFAAEGKAERARLAADEALQARFALERDAHRAELAAEGAFKAWGRKLVAEEDQQGRRAEATVTEEPEPPKAEARMPEAPDPREAATHMPAVTAPPAVEARPPAPDTLTCQIAYWRGYRKSAFYARAFDEEGYEVAVAESPLFKTQGKGTPDRTEDAVAAHKALLAQLSSDGWELQGGGDTWFGKTLRRRLSAG